MAAASGIAGLYVIGYIIHMYYTYMYNIKYISLYKLYIIYTFILVYKLGILTYNVE